MVNFDISDTDDALLTKIVERAKKESPILIDALSLNMDVCAVNANGCPIDFEKLLNFPAFDFWHDICGIIAHIDRTTGKLRNCFLPRSAR
jgi:hypothetical protein